MRHSTPLIVLFTCALSACGGSGTTTIGNTGYQTARAQSSLEIPPDLVNSSEAALKRPAEGRQQEVLPSLDGITMKSSGNKRWLEITSTTNEVWAKLLDYTIKTGLPVLSENKRDGILETDWIGDDTTDTPTRRALRKRMGNLIGRPPVNNKYIVWLEKLDEQVTALHISHKQLKLSVSEPKRQDDVIETDWIETEGDGLKVLQQLRKMAAFFAGAEIESENSARVVLVETNPEHIILAENSEIALTQVKNAIAASRYIYDNERPEENLIIVKQPEAKGFLSKLSYKKKLGVQLKPVADGEKTRINITSRRGKAIDREEAMPLLYEIAAGLRKNQ